MFVAFTLFQLKKMQFGRTNFHQRREYLWSKGAKVDRVVAIADSCQGFSHTRVKTGQQPTFHKEKAVVAWWLHFIFQVSETNWKYSDQLVVCNAANSSSWPLSIACRLHRLNGGGNLTSQSDSDWLQSLWESLVNFTNNYHLINKSSHTATMLQSIWIWSLKQPLQRRQDHKFTAVAKPFGRLKPLLSLVWL